MVDDFVGSEHEAVAGTDEQLTDKGAVVFYGEFAGSDLIAAVTRRFALLRLLHFALSRSDHLKSRNRETFGREMSDMPAPRSMSVIRCPQIGERIADMANLLFLPLTVAGAFIGMKLVALRNSCRPQRRVGRVEVGVNPGNESCPVNEVSEVSDPLLSLQLFSLPIFYLKSIAKGVGARITRARARVAACADH